jgi:hypothetical protein
MMEVATHWELTGVVLIGEIVHYYFKRAATRGLRNCMAFELAERIRKRLGPTRRDHGKEDVWVGSRSY